MAQQPLWNRIPIAASRQQAACLLEYFQVNSSICVSEDWMVVVWGNAGGNEGAHSHISHHNYSPCSITHSFPPQNSTILLSQTFFTATQPTLPHSHVVGKYIPTSLLYLSHTTFYSSISPLKSVPSMEGGTRLASNSYSSFGRLIPRWSITAIAPAVDAPQSQVSISNKSIALQ